MVRPLREGEGLVGWKRAVTTPIAPLAGVGGEGVLAPRHAEARRPSLAAGPPSSPVTPILVAAAASPLAACVLQPLAAHALCRRSQISRSCFLDGMAVRSVLSLRLSRLSLDRTSSVKGMFFTNFQACLSYELAPLVGWLRRVTFKRFASCKDWVD